MRYSDADRVALETAATVNRFTVVVADDAINSQVIDDLARSFQDVGFHGVYAAASTDAAGVTVTAGTGAGTLMVVVVPTSDGNFAKAWIMRSCWAAILLQ
jgi:hypothetical protein